RIDIWVEKALWELALGWFARIVLTEVKGKRVVPTFPIGPLLAGDGAVPDHEVRRPVGHRLRLRHEPLIQSKQAKHQVRRNTIGGHRRCEKNRKKITDVRVVLPPGLALLREAAACDPSRHGGGGGWLLVWAW
ncbi:Os10g0536050, partial [Oryza sativa Japonica Group]